MLAALSDTMLGSAILAAFLVVVLAVGWVLYRIKNAALAREWTPLLPLIEGGRVVGDGGGGATSWLTGTYRGRRVTASFSPDVAKYAASDDAGHHRNSFSVTLDDVPGERDWRLAYERRATGGEWHVSAEGQALQSALESRGRPIVADLGAGDVDYTRASRELRFSEDVRPLQVPPLGRFRAVLDALLQLAEMNASVNARSRESRDDPATRP
jgi:hypothetical protein